ncbi:hypothetical protein EBR25_11510 [bacterium]|nr:hypothetical protein [bacterium]
MLRNLSYLKVALALSICILPSSLYAAPSEGRVQDPDSLPTCSISVIGQLVNTVDGSCENLEDITAETVEFASGVVGCDLAAILDLISNEAGCDVTQKPTTEVRTAETTGNNNIGRR